MSRKKVPAVDTRAGELRDMTIAERIAASKLGLKKLPTGAPNPKTERVQGVLLSAKIAKGKKMAYLRYLVKMHPDARALELHRAADKNIVGDMKFETFENRVSEIRRKLKIPN